MTGEVTRALQRLKEILPIKTRLDNLDKNFADIYQRVSCADNLCTEMIFLQDQTTAFIWWQHDQVNHEVFTLAEAIEFAAGFSKPMMSQG